MPLRWQATATTNKIHKKKSKTQNLCDLAVKCEFEWKPLTQAQTQSDIDEVKASSARLQMKRDICMFCLGLEVNRVITNGPSIAQSRSQSLPRPEMCCIMIESPGN